MSGTTDADRQYLRGHGWVERIEHWWTHPDHWGSGGTIHTGGALAIQRRADGRGGEEGQ